MGPSGCGKSTLISLLERFYEPSNGTILFSGRNICTIDASTYRRALALVAQEPKLFEGTIQENVLLGLRDADPQSDPEPEIKDRMIQACQDAEIHEFIMSLPDGYSTELGVNAQMSLSGGQKQRLCIARALLRKPRLLLLDEATSNLDSQSERLIQNAMERLASKRAMTIITVAHRLATIQKADMIHVFGEVEGEQTSRILESGTHSQLLLKRGPYWQMVRPGPGGISRVTTLKKLEQLTSKTVSSTEFRSRDLTYVKLIGNARRSLIIRPCAPSASYCN